MSFIGDMFSTDKGIGYQASGTNVMVPVTNDELMTGKSQVNTGLDQQRQFLAALQAQNGIGNQSAVFAQQQALANQLQDQANGIGPNPAMAQLANTTGQNVQQQAALMGGQRGVSSNAGLLARQAAMQGAGIQQQSAGQAALMNAQQQLAARQQLQQQQALMGGLAGTQVAQQAAGLNSYNNAAQNNLGMQYGALQGFNNANVGMQGNMNNANASLAAQNAKGQWGFMAGLTNGASSMAGGGAGGGGGGGGMGAMMGGAEGGEVGPDSIAPPDPKKQNPTFSLMPQQQSQAPAFSLGVPQLEQAPKDNNYSLGSDVNFKPNHDFASYFQSNMQTPTPAGGNPPAADTGGQDTYDSGEKIGKSVQTAIKMAFMGAQGGMIPGQADVSGNSIKNDKVPAILSPKEIVLPRSVTMSEDAPEKAKKFVEAIMAKGGMRAKK